MKRRDFLIKGMQGLALLSISGCNTLQEWAEKQNKRIKQEEYDLLSKYTCDTEAIPAMPGDTRWHYVIEDINKHKELYDLISAREIDKYSLTSYYRVINEGKEPVAGNYYKRIKWCFGDSD